MAKKLLILGKKVVEEMLDEGIDYLVTFVHYRRGDITCICNYSMLTYIGVHQYAQNML